MKTFSTTSEAYLQTVEDVFLRPDHVTAPRGMTIREILDYQFQVNEPCQDPIVTRDPERNKKIASYTAKEMKLYRDGTDSADKFAAASSFWKAIANPDGTINSAYGKLIWVDKTCGNQDYDPQLRTPWQWCLDALTKDKDTRQAVLRFNRPDHLWTGNKDQVCTLHILFVIRDNRLNASCVMRSNDVVRGLVYDLPFFCSLAHKMVEELLPTYPELIVGHYRHLAHSMHIYERDFDAVKKMLGT